MAPALTKRDLHAHILSEHVAGRGLSADHLSADAKKAALHEWHVRLHADLSAAHGHDPKNGAAIPLGDVLPFGEAS